MPGYNVQHSFQPGYSLGQQPAAMSYPGITPAPTAPRGHVTPHGAFGYQSYPYVTPTQSYDSEFIDYVFIFDIKNLHGSDK